MRSRRLTATALAATALLSLTVLAGCQSMTASASPSDDTAAEPAPPAVGAAWLEGGEALAIVVEGSSSCVPTLGDVSFTGDTLTVAAEVDDSGPCTADLAPHATYIPVPEGISTMADLTVTVTGDVQGSTTLPGQPFPADAAGHTPGAASAGWVSGMPGMLVLETYGDPTAPPVFESAQVSGSMVEITVSAPTGPTSKTLLPTLTLVHVDGSVSSDAAEFHVSGTNVATASGPIAGRPA